MERRQNNRKVKHVQVRFWRRGDITPQAGYTADISPTGMFIQTNQPLTSGDRLRVEVLDRDSGFMIEAKVARSFKVSPHLQNIKRSGMGVHFLTVEELVGELLRGGSGTSGVAVTDGEAAPVNGVYPVRYTTPEQLLKAFQRDISTGGLFVTTRFPAELDARIIVELHLPHTGAGQPPPPLRFPARVVQRFSPQTQGGGTNLMAGMGVELLDRGAAMSQLAPVVQALQSLVRTAAPPPVEPPTR